MKVSYAWLQTFFSKKLPPVEAVAEALTMHAFEVEGIEGGVLDVKVLPDRAHDCLSHIGIAREIGAILQLPISLKTPKAIKSEQTEARVTLSVQVPDLVPRAMKRVVEGIEIRESPQWLKDRLAQFGQKSINAVVDATNFVTLEMGQPVHVFDYDALAEGDAPGEKPITIRSARAGEKITMLDGAKFDLDPSALVISDHTHALDIAGVKGGLDSGVSPATTRVVLSACTFDPASIRRTSQKFGIRTEASVRFEHGISPELAARGMARLSELLWELARGPASPSQGGPKTRFGKIHDVYPKKQKPRTIRVHATEVNRVLGTDLDEPAVRAILGRLGLASGKIPPERLDLVLPENVIEEVGRISDYDRLPARAPIEEVRAPARNAAWEQARALRELLRGAGYTEVMNYAFAEKGQVKLMNPMTAEKSHLRATLRDDLARNLSENLRFFDEVKIFEIAKVFLAQGEQTMAGIAMARKKITPAEQVAEVKGVLDLVGVEAEIREGVAEFPLAQIEECAPQVAPIPKFPSIRRDVALFVPPQTTVREVERVIRAHAGPRAERVELFDVFEKGDARSLAFSVIFRANDRTLSDKEANEMMGKVIAALEEREGWKVRG